MTEVDILLMGPEGAGKTTFINSLRGVTDLEIRDDADEAGEMDEVHIVQRTGDERTYKLYVYDGVGTDRTFENIVLLCGERIPLTRPPPPGFSEPNYPDMYIFNTHPLVSADGINSAADLCIGNLRERYPDRDFLDLRGDVSNIEDATRMWNSVTCHVH